MKVYKIVVNEKMQGVWNAEYMKDDDREWEYTFVCKKYDVDEWLRLSNHYKRENNIIGELNVVEIEVADSEIYNSKSIIGRDVGIWDNELLMKRTTMEDRAMRIR